MKLICKIFNFQNMKEETRRIIHKQKSLINPGLPETTEEIKAEYLHKERE